jgi:hypothetical protein
MKTPVPPWEVEEAVNIIWKALQAYVDNHEDVFLTNRKVLVAEGLIRGVASKNNLRFKHNEFHNSRKN